MFKITIATLLALSVSAVKLQHGDHGDHDDHEGHNQADGSGPNRGWGPGHDEEPTDADNEESSHVHSTHDYHPNGIGDTDVDINHHVGEEFRICYTQTPGAKWEWEELDGDDIVVHTGQSAAHGVEICQDFLAQAAGTATIELRAGAAWAREITVADETFHITIE